MDARDPVEPPRVEWRSQKSIDQAERQLALAEREVAFKEKWADGLARFAEAAEGANKTPALQNQWTWFDLPEEQQLVMLRKDAIGMVLKSYYMVHEGMTESIFNAADKVVDYILHGREVADGSAG